MNGDPTVVWKGFRKVRIHAHLVAINGAPTGLQRFWQRGC
ncbi:hypothetical protein SAMN05518863_104146 [Candidatus Pantoea symbiotica]|jgi:hypothetical protein|uniref:Transposase n=1 Tax=Candidatus Pantoea symbiotica TaxID=1884370 RepID=A0A1I3WCJ4_9GAMM|nr:hypothetical protein SAMN05518863_104146 [Pantoea symbiotica]SFU71803.1 hypothetical protein SAMN05518864_104146 [Pantoea sp. YR525]